MDFQDLGTSQSVERSGSVTPNRTLRENTEQVAIATANKALRNSYSMLNDNLLPPLVPKESPCYVNIYLFIALLRDFLMLFQ